MPQRLICIVPMSEHTPAQRGLPGFMQHMGVEQVLAEVCETTAAVHWLEAHQPDMVVILAASSQAIEALAYVTAVWPQVRVSLLRLQGDAASGGAEQRPEIETPGVIPTVPGAAALAQAQDRRVSSGETSGPVLPQRLTPRQRDVLRLIVQGLTTKDIARHLQRSVKTIEAHRSQIMQRLGAHNVAELVRKVIQYNL